MHDCTRRGEGRCSRLLGDSDQGGGAGTGGSGLTGMALCSDGGVLLACSGLRPRQPAISLSVSLQMMTTLPCPS